MNKKKSLIYLLSSIFLLGFFLTANLPGIINNFALAKKKTKWQIRLEKHQIAKTFWRKYLPKVTWNEYKKAMKKYKKFLRNNPSYQIAQTSQIAQGVQATSTNYPLHQNISTTFFWIGEKSGSENGYIPNSQSAWDDKWLEHFGGVDDPNSRNGYFPTTFTPRENPFYFALPYNDFDENGNRRANVGQVISWVSQKSWDANESMCKNRWIKIIKEGKTAYAQWEDAGPMVEDDVNYVFGSSTPKSSFNNHAGLDVSPAVRDYLGLEDIDSCSWQFVDSQEVPDGPWKQIVTTSNIYWE